ncbi:hypothetical protein LCER1_G006035 [Lachnellula cervina]|uniref:Pre-mRNA-splicing factor 38B n=1 Tax=Lachnellula cervina TaxID=1316786 RepID=A0A7D8US51_9HELO|nr:hypothetical protein LCER1_G006035 [Lachnellula cervina]
MSNSEALTDEYLAELMDKEAKRSLKYSGMGFEGNVTTSKPPPNKPKPNTRFLTNIIKDTTNHNQALLAKEAAESRARLQSLATAERRGEKSKGVGGGDIRRRQLGDIAAILGNGGRRSKRPRSRGGEKEGAGRSDDGDEEPSPKKSRQEIRRSRDEGREEDVERTRDRRDDGRLRVQNIRDEGKDNGSEKRHSKEHRKRRHPSQEDISDEEDSKRRPKSDRRRRHKGLEDDEEPKTSADGASKRKHGSRDADSEEEEESRSHRHRHRRHRSRSTSKDREQRRRHRSRSRSPREHRDKEARHGKRSSRNRPRSPRRPRKESPSTKKQEQTDYDSDPLDSIIGPAPPPPVRSRGRGTFSHLSSGIDSRFSADYDPTADVRLDADEENDWDQALEALRDRQKWKQQGADRLRAAGFTDEEIEKWEKGGEKREEDVKWAKKGERREWDRGKILDGETGAVSIEPMFGRLKDS